MSDFQALEHLSESMYNGYGFSEKVGISYFYEHRDKLKDYRYVDLIDFQMRRYPDRYVVDFMLSTDFLWRCEPKAMWVDVLFRADARPSQEKSYLEKNGNYCDIEFLCRYVGVDALEFLMASSISKIEKQNIKRYFTIFPYDLIGLEVDAEDLDGVFFTGVDSLHELRDSLRIEYNFSLFSESEDTINSYISRLDF